MDTGYRHQCLIYEGPPSEKLPVLATMICQKLGEGYRCLYLNSAPMVAGIRSCLAAMDVDVAGEVAKASLVLSSEPVSPGTTFDIDRMLYSLEDSLDQALSDGYKGLWATGDMTWELSPELDFSKLFEYELRLEELFQRRPELSGICQYHRDSLPQEAMRDGLQTHQGLFINETLSHMNPHYEPSELPAASLVSDSQLDEAVNALCKMK